MKNTILMIALFAFGWVSNPVAAQNNQFIKSQIVEASADKVWEQLRQLDGLEKIAPQLITDSWLVNDAQPGVGAKRSCTAPGTPKGQAGYTETITEFSDTERYYRYAVTEGTPTKNMVNSLRVVDLGYQKCMVVWTSQRDGFMENPQMTEEQFNQFLNMAGQSPVNGVAAMYD